MVPDDSQPKPRLGELLSDEQSAQFSRLLVELASRGFGRLEIVVERYRVRRMIPHRVIHRPGSRCLWPTPANDLEAWSSDLAEGLAEIMGGGWGVLAVDVEYGQITRIDVAPSLPVSDALFQGSPST